MEHIDPDLHKRLMKLSYPVRKPQIRKHLEDHGAGFELLKSVDKLPEREYTSTMDINSEIEKNSR